MKKSLMRLLSSLVDLLLLLPLFFQLVVVVMYFMLAALASIFSPSNHGEIIGATILVLVVLIVAYVCFRAGRRRVRKDYGDGTLRLSQNFFGRYSGVVIACGYTMLAALIGICLPPLWNGGGVFGTAAAVIFWSHLPSAVVLGLMMIVSMPQAWPFLIPPFFIYLLYATGMAWEFRRMRAPRARWRGKAVFVAAFALCAVVFAWRADILRNSVMRFSPSVERMDDTIYTSHYTPFQNGGKLVKIPISTLVIKSEHPRLDGATALYPVYAAAAQATYQNIASENAQKRVLVSTTPQAYENLIEGRADIIFCAQPSPAQIAAAKAKGVNLQLTPIGREAFVFFVNEANPVEAITSAQVRAIYTKRITNWSEVGGSNAAILPFQRPANSGSQTAMEQLVMRNASMVRPMKEEQVQDMGGIILETAAYRNSANAIGYSFRFFVTTMTGVKGIKLLKIDGVAPTVETIRDGTYPYAGNFYAITTDKTTNAPHVRELIAWFLSEQGQKLIEDTGYVSLGKPSPPR